MRLIEDGKRAFPVELIRFGGDEWIVSIFDETGWVRRLRKAGEVRLRRGRRSMTYAVNEVHGEHAAAVFAVVCRANRLNPLVQKALRAGHDHPVFRLESIRQSSTQATADKWSERP